MPRLKLGGNTPPKWLQQLQAEKIEQSQRAAKADNCPRCGRQILRGRSDDIMYWIATVDQTLLDPIGEAVARASGLHTYDLIAKYGGKEHHLAIRDIHHMKAAPHWPIVADHKCDGHTVDATEYAPATTPAPAADPWSLF
jgi:hypothetical protein